MSASAPGVRKPLNKSLKRWLWRLSAAAVLLSLIGLASHPAISPLMCKIYG